MDLKIGNTYLMYFTGDESPRLRTIKVVNESITAYEVNDINWCCETVWVNKQNFVLNKEGVSYNTSVSTIEYGAVIVRKTTSVEGVYVIIENITGQNKDKDSAEDVKTLDIADKRIGGEPKTFNPVTED